jgi:antitoxin component YwqK of YwqJK toxin-antitoxin module
MNGPYKEFDEKGTLRLSGAYINGEKKGAWLSYDENGKVILKEKF